MSTYAELVEDLRKVTLAVFDHDPMKVIIVRDRDIQLEAVSDDPAIWSSWINGKRQKPHIKKGDVEWFRLTSWRRRVDNVDWIQVYRNRTSAKGWAKLDDFVEVVSEGVINQKAEGFYSLDRPEQGAKTLRQLRVDAFVEILEQRGEFYRIGNNEWIWSGFIDVE